MKERFCSQAAAKRSQEIQLILRSIAFYLTLYFDIIVIFIHLKNRHLSLRKDVLSYFAHGKLGILLNSAFIALCIGQVILAHRVVKTYGISYSPLILLTASLGLLLAGIFNCSKDGKETLWTRLHLIGAVLEFGLFPIFYIVLYIEMIGEFGSIFIRNAGIILLLSVTIYLFAFINREKSRYIGLIQKINIFLITTGIKFLLIFYV